MPNDGVFYTVKLNIKRIQEEEDFIDDSFNAVIDDIDNKVVGISHLTSGAHWHIWEEDTNYAIGDVIRWPNMKSHQYAKCIQAGTSGNTRPTVNVTGSEVTSGSTKWKVMSLTMSADINGGAISIWQGGGIRYERGDAVLYASSLYRCSVAYHYSSNNFEDDKDNWQEVYASIRPWEADKFYYLDDVVIVDLKLYKCLEDHTSASDFDLPVEKARWAYIGDYANVYEWTPSTYYMKNQLVTIQGILYRSLYTHTSDANDIVNDMDFWEPVFASVQTWSDGSYYGAGVLILANNKFYKCIVPHVAESTFTLDADNWELVHISPTIIEDWSIATPYSQYQVVQYDGNLYRAYYGHTSDLEFDPTKWELLTESINDWTSQGTYVVGQYVNYQNILYKCIVANDDSAFTPAKWQRVGGGGIDTWATNTDYSAGDIVVNNNKIYSCNIAHTSSSFNSDADKWTEISACITRIPDWEVNKDYVVGDLVAHDAKIYRCTNAHTSESTWSQTEEAKWEELSPTINEINTWTPSTDYAIGQLVIHNNKLYRCNTAHTSDSSSFNTDIANWDEIGSSGGIDTWKSNEDYTTSSVVIYNNKIYKCNTAHTSGSTFDPTKWDEISSADIGLWQPSTDYKVGNVVIKDNQIYRCKTLHTSDSSDFYTDIANWDILDTKWIASDWVTGTKYYQHEVVLYDNTLYECNTSHLAGATFEADKTNWDVLNANIRQWLTENSYNIGDVVSYKNKLYRCKTANNDKNFKFSKWNEISKCNIEMWRSAPDPNVLGVFHFDNPDDIYYNSVEGSSFGFVSVSPLSVVINKVQGAKFGYSLFPITSNTNTVTDDLSFTTGTEIYTIEFWAYMTQPTVGNTPKSFKIGDDVSIFTNYPGILPDAYVRINGQDSNPISYGVYHHYAFVISGTEISFYLDGVYDNTYTRAIVDADINFFLDGHGTDGFYDDLVVTSGEKYTSSFTVENKPYVDFNYEGYKVDDLVVYEDKIYRCIEDNNDVSFTPSKWVEVSESIVYPDWSSTTDYSFDDIVIYQNQLYKCITSHTSTNDFNGDYDKWISLDKNCFIHNWASNIPYYVNEVVKYDDVLYRCKTSHVSTLNDKPSGAILYEATGNTIEVDDTTTIPYLEIIDLGSLQKITDIDYTESTTGMSFTYTIEVSEDNINYASWDGVSVDSRYIRLTVDSVNIDAGATSPNAHLTDFTVYGDTDKWEKISSGGSADINYATNSDIDNLFI